MMDNDGSTFRNFRHEIRRIKLRMIGYIFVSNFLFLFSSEFLVSVYNNKLDKINADFLYRVKFTFKPMVILIFLVSVVIMCAVILGILKPLFNYMRRKVDYEKARLATIRLPWITLIFQLVFWFVGSTAYFIIKKWKPESGVNYGWVIFMKMALGFLSSVFIVLMVNMMMSPIKKRLNMTSIHAKEKDYFARNKEFFITFAILIYVISNLGYMSYYYFHADFDPTKGGAFKWGILGFGLFLSAISFVLIIMSKRDYSNQVEYLRDKMDEFSRGQMDLSKRIVLINFDEIGELTHSFNQFMEKLNADFKVLYNMVLELKNNAGEVKTSSQELASNTEQQVSGTEEISATMYNFSSVMDSIRENILRQTEIIVQNAANVNQLFAGLQSIVENAKNLKTSNDTNMQSATTGIQTVNTSVTKTFKMNNNMKEIAEKIKKAGEQTESIDEILASIESIADQTNMLSMNAAIEAAHAGEAGKGFAIVANEIRELADTSTKSVQSISDMIRKIKESVEEAILIARQGEQEANVNTELAQTAGESLESIVKNMENTTNMIENINVISQEQNVLIQNFLKETENLKSFSLTIKKAVEEQAENASQIQKSLIQMTESQEENARYTGGLSSLSGDLDDIGNRLTHVVEQFRISENSGSEAESEDSNPPDNPSQ